MDKVLVTGAAGFIGSHLCQRLLAQGYMVVGIDAMLGQRWIKEYNLRPIRHHPNFTLVTGNLMELNLSRLLKQVKVIFHLAASPGVRSSWGNDFPQYVQNNILATQRLLEAALHFNLEKFILASTSSIYGPVTGPAREDRRPAPLSPYGVTKLAAESLAQVYYRNFRLPLVILRYFTVYGPRQRPDMAFHRFILAILKGHPITVFGSGDQTRDFTYVSDIIAATLLAMTKDVTGHVFNIGGDFRYSVNHVLKLIQQLTGQKIIRQALPPQPGEPLTTWADISSAQKVLGYKPKVTLTQGLKEEIQDLRKLYGLPG